MRDERKPLDRALLWLLDRVPSVLRTRWPLRRFYWQQEDHDRAAIEAEQFRELL